MAQMIDTASLRIRLLRMLLPLIVFWPVLTPSAAAQANYSDIPWRFAAHSQGQLQLQITNRGRFGHWFDTTSFVDPYTGDQLYGCDYPRESGLTYLAGELQVGGVIGQDSIVSGYFIPPEHALSNFRVASINPGSEFYSKTARSILDLTCEYGHLDTFRIPFSEPTEVLQVPTGVWITQRSMAWNASTVDDFILIEYELLNLGDSLLRDVFIGITAVVSGVHGASSEVPMFHDGLIGALHGFTYTDDCYSDSFLLAYGMDTDGDPIDGAFTAQSPRAAVGVMFLGGPAEDANINFNWRVPLINPLSGWWGPRKQGTLEDLFRELGPYLEGPQGDANHYYLASHPEIDYDLLFAALDHRADGWLGPSVDKDRIASGQVRYPHFLITYGPFDLSPKEHKSVTLAVVAGDNVHHDPNAFENLFVPGNPQPYYDQLNFSELAENARWAQWVYDNPGRDTDGDGYRGEFTMCNGDTVWYKGDGVPDFTASTPPVPPIMRVMTETGKLTIRWNGFYSETTRDEFSSQFDFEGYRVYYALDELVTSLTMLSSFDYLNYDLYKYTEVAEGIFKWRADDAPYSLDSLRTIMGDSSLIPELWTRIKPYEAAGEYYYFQPVDFNRSELGLPRGISKAFPNATDPGVDSTLWSEDDITREHGVPLPKFYEYEYTLDNLLATIPYYVSVTAFDFGFKGGGLPSAESDPLATQTVCFAQLPSDSVVARDLDAYVYPNPYRIDGGYSVHGYEWRVREQEEDRNRKLNFANLPPLCTISIYSLDGDLVRSFEHDYPPDDPAAMHDAWDMITRSGMAPVSGLYYWVVESPTRTQIGKFVIIK